MSRAWLGSGAGYSGFSDRPTTAPSTKWQYPANGVVAVSATACTSGLLTLVPMDVGPTAKTFTDLGVGVTTAQVAGTTTTTLGVYKDDGSGGLPNLVGGPVASGTVVLTSTGNRAVTFGTPLTLQPGRYWLAFLYVASVAPTTVPILNCVSTSVGFYADAAITIGTPARGLSASAQSAMPTTQIALTVVGGTTTVFMAMKAQ